MCKPANARRIGREQDRLARTLCVIHLWKETYLSGVLRLARIVTVLAGVRQLSRPVFGAHLELDFHALDQPRLATGPTPSLRVTSRFTENPLKASWSPLGQ